MWSVNLWLSAFPYWCWERAGTQCRDDERVQLLKNVMILLHMAAMNGRRPTGCHYTFSTSTMLFRHQLRSGERPGVWGNIEVSHDHSLQSPELVVLSLSLYIWFVENEPRTTVQSQFMISSTQIMFKKLQTKFFEKPLLNFLPNLMKNSWFDWKYCKIPRIGKKTFQTLIKCFSRNGLENSTSIFITGKNYWFKSQPPPRNLPHIQTHVRSPVFHVPVH